MDYTDPVYSIDGSTTTCGNGNISWNTVAASPFAREVPLDTWDDLPNQLDILRQKPDGYIQNLQVTRPSARNVFRWSVFFGRSSPPQVSGKEPRRSQPLVKILIHAAVLVF